MFDLVHLFVPGDRWQTGIGLGSVCFPRIRRADPPGADRPSARSQTARRWPRRVLGSGCDGGRAREVAFPENRARAVDLQVMTAGAQFSITGNSRDTRNFESIVLLRAML